MQSCLLREVWNASGNEPLLPPSPLAELGSAIHKLLEAAGRGQLEDGQRAEVEATWTELISEAESRMSLSALKRPQVPLKKSISDFEVRKLRACRRAGEIAHDAGYARQNQGKRPPQPTGFELWVETEDGAVGGYIDRVKMTEKGVVLSDYKSGALLDGGTGGEPREVKQAYREQMELYAALYRHNCETWPASLEIVPLQGVPLELLFDAGHAERLLATARRSLRAANTIIEEVENGNADVTTLASPKAEHCRVCLFRPACRAYWAARKRDPDHKWPSDVMGVLREKITLRNGKLRIRIAETASSPVSINVRNLGSSPDRHPRLHRIQTGSLIAVYGLKYLYRSGDYSETQNTVIYQT